MLGMLRSRARAYSGRLQSTFDRSRLSCCLFCALRNNNKATNASLSLSFEGGVFKCFRCNTSGSLVEYEKVLNSFKDVPQEARVAYESAKKRFLDSKSRNGLPLGNTAAGSSTLLLRSFSTDSLLHPLMNSSSSPTTTNASNSVQATQSPEMIKELEMPMRNLLQDWPENEDAEHVSPAVTFLKKRGLTRETCALYRVGARKVDVYRGGIKETADVVTFPFYHKYGEFDPKAIPLRPSQQQAAESVIQRYKVRGVLDKGLMRSIPPGQNAQTFYGWHTVPPNAREIVITEGEIDAMTVYQETKVPTVSVPNGASSFADSLVYALARFDKVILWFDDDMAGREGCEKAIAKITARYGFGKCLVVRPTEAEKLAARKPQLGNGHVSVEEKKNEPDDGLAMPKDANDFLLQGYDVAKILRTRKPLKHDKIITPVETFSELKELFRNPEQRKGKQFTGFPSMNKLLGGHRPGEVTLLSGPTGSGKTTLLSQLSLDLCMAGVPTLWGSFEIDVTRLNHIMMNQFVYRTFYGEWTPQADRALAYPDLRQEPVLRNYFSAFASLPMYYMNFFGSTDIEDVMKVMTHSVESQDVQHIIVDNLQYMVSGSGSEKDWRPKQSMYSAFNKFEAMERALDYFRAFATNRKVHVSVVIHPKKVAENLPLTLDSIMGTAKATQEADNVICIQRLEDGRKTLDLKKNRFDGRLGRMELAFDPETKCFFDNGLFGSGTPTVANQYSSSLMEDPPSNLLGSFSSATSSRYDASSIPSPNGGGFAKFSPNEDAALLQGAEGAVDGSEVEIFEQVKEELLPHRDVETLQARFKQLKKLNA